MSYTDRYDRDIRIQAGAFLQAWGDSAWLWLKAQLIAESDLDPAAQSKAGAMGIAQFMPGTWRDAKAALRLPPDATPFQAAHAIRVAAWYMGNLRAQWRSERSEVDRRRLAQASYNAGLGNILNAQRAARGAVDYAGIIAQLHTITGDANAAETREYVRRIQRIYQQLSGAAP